MWQGLFSLGSKTFYTQRKQRLKMIWYARDALWTSLTLNSIGNSLFLSLQRSRALNFIVDRFQTNNTLIYSHGLSYNVAWYKHLWFKVQFLSIAFVSCSVYMHSCVTRLISNINNRNKLQLMQIIWNVMLYSHHFTFHRKLLVLDSRIRFVFKSRLKQPVHIMAFALLFCTITLPIQCTTHWSPFRGVSNALGILLILHLFYFWPKLHCILRFTLNYLGFLYYIRFVIAP